MKNKPDDRRDNVDRIQYNINRTVLNYEIAEELIAKTEDKQMKSELTQKNKRRKTSLEQMKKEIRDEAIDKENGYE